MSKKVKLSSNWKNTLFSKNLSSNPEEDEKVEVSEQDLKALLIENRDLRMMLRPYLNRNITLIYGISEYDEFWEVVDGCVRAKQLTGKKWKSYEKHCQDEKNFTIIDI